MFSPFLPLLAKRRASRVAATIAGDEAGYAEKALCCAVMSPQIHCSVYAAGLGHRFCLSERRGYTFCRYAARAIGVQGSEHTRSASGVAMPNIAR